MADEKLPSFKAGDKQPRKVKSSPSAGKGGGGGKSGGKAGGKKSGAPTQADQTLGFGRIEEILDHEAPGAVGARLAEILDDLDAGLTKSVTPKDKSTYRKGRAALERTIDMLDYLFRTKEAMQKQALEGKEGAP